jgi:twitching motility protein PilT
MINLQELLTEAIKRGASDVHMVAGKSPIFRINTELIDAGRAPVAADEAAEMVRQMVGTRRFAQFLRRRDLDFSTTAPGLGRFRVNAHYQRESVAIAFRAIPQKVPPMASLNLPPVVTSFTDLPRGLVLVTGETGSGKSTTLASMIDAINHKYGYHVITLEDPIEYELVSDKCVIEQREVGTDVPSFASGLRHVLRQDPDIILVGEMRDLETTSAAITAAETGHLVLSTLHTQSASQTVCVRRRSNQDVCVQHDPH